MVDPTGPPIGDDHMERGGAWSSDASELRVVNRNSDPGTYRTFGTGFRLARSLP